MANHKIKNYILRLGMVSVVCLQLFGCQSNNSKSPDLAYQYENSTESEENSYNYFEDYIVRANEVLLYHSYKENLGIYNTDTLTWCPIYDSESNNLFAYNVKGAVSKDMFYSIGSSSFNKFSVVTYSKEEHIAKLIMNIPKTDSVMPIGYYDNKMYFMHNKNDLSGNETRAIAYIENEELIDVLELDTSLLTNAVIIGDDLYYAIYVESDDIYELYCYSLMNETNEKVSEINTDRIYRYKNRIIYVDENKKLVDLNNNVYYELENNSDIEILCDYGLLLEVFINADNNIVCKITNLTDNTLVTTVEYFDGYIIDENILNLYCEGGIKTMEIGAENE